MISRSSTRARAIGASYYHKHGSSMVTARATPARFCSSSGSSSIRDWMMMVVIGNEEKSSVLRKVRFGERGGRTIGLGMYDDYNKQNVKNGVMLFSTTSAKGAMASPLVKEEEEMSDDDDDDNKVETRAERKSKTILTSQIKLELAALTREKSGRLSAKRVRKEGLVPCVLFKAGEIETTKEIISVSEFEVEKLLRAFTIYGLRTKILDIILDDGERIVRAIPQQIQMHAYKDQVNNIVLMAVDPETIVKVPIPVKVSGQEDCPGTKMGAFVSHTRKTITVKCRSDQIPEAFFVDVSNLGIKDNIKIANLDIPDGVRIIETDRDTPIVKLSGKLKKQ